MREKELRNLIVQEFLEVIEDPRVERSRKHSLETILVLSLLAVICGADSFVSIEKFGIAKRDWLAGFLDLDNGIPSHDTIGRVFSALDCQALARAFQRWTASMAVSSREQCIAIDGKTLRRSFKKAGDGAFVHMVSAWSARNQVVLGQVKADEKSNEITAIPALLDLIDVNRALVTIDAIGTQTAIAEKIIDRGGDYLLPVKGNQSNLHVSLIEHFRDSDPLLSEMDFAETQDHGHGRDEVRRAWVSDATEQISGEDRWRNLSSLIRVESTRIVNGERSTENRYFISSRADLTAQKALASVRSHWGIENGLHWVLDVAFREDDSRVRAGNAAANFSAVRQLALGLLKQRTETKVGIKNRRLCAAWDHNFLLRVIGISA